MNEHDYTPWWDPDAPKSAASSAPGEASRPSVPPAEQPQSSQSGPERHPLRARVQRWAQANIHTVLFMAIGLLVACSMLAFGFWRTVLVVFCVGAGYVYGSWRDGNPRLLAHIRHFYERWINDNPFMK